MNIDKLKNLKPGDKIKITVSGKKQKVKVKVNNPEKQFLIAYVQYQRVKHKVVHLKQYSYAQILQKSVPFDYKKPVGLLIVGVLTYFLGPKALQHSNLIVEIVNKVMESL